MRRAPFVIAATAAGVAAVLSYHSSATTVSLANLNGGAGTRTTTSSSPGSTSSTSPAGQVTHTTTTSGTTSGATTTTTAPATTRTATGAVVDYDYGMLSVEVTERGSTITDVTIASLDDSGNPRSASIDEQSIPILEQEALSAQSANIQSVSGASFTSEGFISSLQSALARLGR